MRISMKENKHGDKMKSVVSYPWRGKFGNWKYRGNCSGLLVKDLLEHFKPALVFDPMEGSGTVGDVCREMNIRYIGKDLKKGFDLTGDALPDESPDFIFFQPPYWNIIPYSDNKNDISNAGTYPEFMRKINVCLSRLSGFLKEEGILCILIGDKRKEGKYYPLASDIAQEMKKFKEMEMKSILVKVQHNTKSEGIDYKGKFIPIQHEYCLIYRKKKTGQTILKLFEESFME